MRRNSRRHHAETASQHSSQGNRRRFIQTALLGAGASYLSSVVGCGASSTANTSNSTSEAASKVPASVGAVPASEAPEVSEVKFGIIALTDCSPIVIAHEKGLFAKYGIKSTVSKGASWAAIRDSLSNGDIQATHMLLGMPLASTMGLLGAPKKPMVIPWLLNRNGQAISMKKEWLGKVAADPKVLKPMADEAHVCCCSTNRSAHSLR